MEQLIKEIMNKKAMPWLSNIDLRFEHLNFEDRKKIVNDLEKGNKITLINGDTISKKDIDSNTFRLLKKLKTKGCSNDVKLKYDEKTHKYKKN